jgi:gluconokinase
VLTWRETLNAEHPPALDPDDYHRRTGCFAHPAYWPAKIARLHDSGLRAARYVSFGDYLLLRLTGELCTSISTASGTGVFDPNRLAWDEETLEALGLTSERLPRIEDDPVEGVVPPLGDGACSNVGAGCVTRERAVVMVGTSGAARVVYAADRAEPRPGLFLYRLDAARVVEGGSLSDGGNLWAWLRRILKDVDSTGVAEEEPAGHGLSFLPLLGGERAPGWNARARGAIAGLTFDTTPRDVVQAALEGVAYRFAAVLELMPETRELVATGRALLESPDWMQILADVLGLPVTASGVAEGSLRGAAVVTLERLGETPDPAPLGSSYVPRVTRYEAYRWARERQADLYRGVT